MTSKLGVNFHKSKISSLGVDKNNFKMYSQAFNRNIMEVSFKYLGMTKSNKILFLATNS